MNNQAWRAATAVALAVALVPWSSGCATGFHVRAAGAEVPGIGGGTVEVRVYDNGSTRNRGTLSSRKVAIELVARDARPEKVVHTGDAASWSVAGLEPGRYELRVWWPDAKDATGRARPVRKRLVVAAGQATAADVVLRDAGKTWLFVAIGVGVVVGGLYLSGWSPMPEHIFAAGTRW